MLELQANYQLYRAALRLEIFVKRQIFNKFKQNLKTKQKFHKGFTKLRKVFIRQSLSLEFLSNLKKMKINHSSTSLTVPVQNRSLI
jgi:hypothetical protein